MKYNMKSIMTKAWEIARKNTEITFGEALHRAWLIAKTFEVNAQIIADAKAKAGVIEETKTWYGWKVSGREVTHESKCLFQARVFDGAKGDGAMRTLSFFGFSQTHEIEEVA